MGISQLVWTGSSSTVWSPSARWTLTRWVSKLIETGAMAHSIVVVSSVFDSLAQSYIAPYAACAMGEYFWYLDVTPSWCTTI